MATANLWNCPKCHRPNCPGLKECFCGYQRITQAKICHATLALPGRQQAAGQKTTQHSGNGVRTPINDFSGLTTDEKKLNKTERAFLAYLRAQGREVGIQNITIKLGWDLRYTPDFMTLENGRVTFWETKGWMRDDARCKLYTAARKCVKWADFILVKREGGQWKQTKVNP
jgi:hypothetical protein